MKRYKVSWIEKHSTIVDALDESHAYEKAKEEDHFGTLDATVFQEIENVEAEHEMEDR